MAKKKTSAKKKAAPATKKAAARPRPKAKAASNAKRPAAKPAKAPAAPSMKQQFLNSLAREHATTLKVMRAFPTDQAGFQPHPRSQSAQKLMWTFTQEQALANGALEGEVKFGSAPAPETIPELVAAYEKAVQAFVNKLNKTPDAQLIRTVKFPVGPGTIGDIPVIDFLWFMLMDKIHHRGQLSVYLRMAGGLVPSIYGPSADEPWN